MARYILELEAENGLLEIGRYTARTWGLEQTESYLGQLERHFEGLGAGRFGCEQFSSTTTSSSSGTGAAT